MDDLTNALRSSEISDDNIIVLMKYLEEKEYDTDSLLEDVQYESSFLRALCENELQNVELFEELKQIGDKYTNHHKSHTFKDMDYALSKYYVLMGRNIDNYYTSKGIGKFEIYCAMIEIIVFV